MVREYFSHKTFCHRTILSQIFWSHNISFRVHFSHRYISLMKTQQRCYGWLCDHEICDRNFNVIKSFCDQNILSLKSSLTEKFCEQNVPQPKCSLIKMSSAKCFWQKLESTKPNQFLIARISSDPRILFVHIFFFFFRPILKKHLIKFSAHR